MAISVNSGIVLPSPPDCGGERQKLRLTTIAESDRTGQPARHEPSRNRGEQSNHWSVYTKATNHPPTPVAIRGPLGDAMDQAIEPNIETTTAAPVAPPALVRLALNIKIPGKQCFRLGRMSRQASVIQSGRGTAIPTGQPR
jgi:hypothetical protein